MFVSGPTGPAPSLPPWKMYMILNPPAIASPGIRPMTMAAAAATANKRSFLIELLPLGARLLVRPAFRDWSLLGRDKRRDVGHIPNPIRHASGHCRGDLEGLSLYARRMVGRFTNRYTWREIVELYRVTEPYIAPVSNMRPRYNFAPLQSQVVIRLDKEGRREPVVMRWGLVPSWSKDDSGASRCINAKSETVATKPSFRAAFKARPCFVPADGFYEWAKLPGGEKQPYFITTRDREPFAFAGLWEWWPERRTPGRATARNLHDSDDRTEHAMRAHP
jgi:putative SOS response-associated peptidase YedK